MDEKKTNKIRLLLDSLGEFADMQAVHLDHFRAGKMANLPVWQQQRESASRLLTHCFEDLALAGDRPDGQAIALLQEKMARIQQTEGELLRLVERQHVIAKEKIGKLRKGRKALSGYSIRGTATSPRFLSSRS